MNRAKMSFAAMDLLVIGLLAVLLINLITVPLVSPQHKTYTTERRPEFAWGGMQGEYVLFIDDDQKFKTPVTAEVSGNSYIPAKGLDFGTYYWKVQSGLVSSEVRRLTIGSSVILSRSGNGVKNDGNAELSIHAPSITGAFVLGINESVEIGERENVTAEQA